MTYLDYDVVFPQLDKINEFVFETVTTDFSNPKKIKKINYTRKIAITRYKDNGNDKLFQLFLSEIEITSNLSTENIIFLKRIGAAFDEVEVEVNNYGKIIKIVNFEELGKRWEIVRAKLAIDNVGFVVESYLQDISSSVEDEQKMITFFSDYKMFGLYFFSLYRTPSPIERQKKIIDCGSAVMLEHVHPKDEKLDTYFIKGKPFEENSETDSIKYDGTLEYREHQIELATLEIEKERLSILYNINKTSL